MHRTLIILLLCIPTLAFAASNTAEGRWEGAIRIPGFSSPLVVGGVVYFGSTDGNMYALE